MNGKTVPVRWRTADGKPGRVFLATQRSLVCVLLTLVLPAGSFAQEGPVDQPLSAPSAGRRGVTIVPRVAVTETFTDNANLSNTAKQSDLVTEVIPGIRITSDFGRVKGYFDYSLNGRVSGTSGTSLQNNLTAFGSVVAIENFAFVDVSASITQQSVSGLGLQSPGNSFSNANRSETSTYRVSPYLRGSLAGVADYETRYSYGSTRSQSAGSSDVTTNDLLVSLKGRPSASRLGWSVQAAKQSAAYSLGRTAESDSLTGSLSYALNPQLVVTASAGQEGNNYSTLNKERTFTSGQGIQWSPSPNASFSASRQTRQFGQSHNVNLSYRTARTAWSFTDSQDATNTPSQSSLGSLGPIYDLYFTQFAAVEPDPVKRAVLVNTFLQVNGINPNAIVVSNFLTSAVSLQRRQDLSFTLLGVRDSITFTASRTETSRLDRLSTAIDDLSNSTAVRQTGLSVSYAHRLTPDTSMNVTGLNQHSTDSTGLQETFMNSVNLGFSTRLGLKSTAAINARRVIFDSRTSPYVENAISGTITVQF
jgi:uncharacterized protein (PEP-CTERM system associated)